MGFKKSYFNTSLLILLQFAFPLHALAAHTTDRKVYVTDIVSAGGTSVYKFPTSAPTANRVCTYNSDGEAISSSVSDTTLGYLDASSSIQTQLNGKSATGHTHVSTDITDFTAAARAAAVSNIAYDSTGWQTGTDISPSKAAVRNEVETLVSSIAGKQASGAYLTGMTGDVVATGPGGVTATIQTGVVTNAKMADMATAKFKGRTTAGSGAPEDLSATQATAMLNAAVGDSGSGGTKGLVPAPATGDAAAGKFLKADMTYAVPAGGGGGGLVRVDVTEPSEISVTTGTGTSTNTGIESVTLGRPSVNGTCKTSDTTLSTTDYSVCVNCTTGCTITMPSPSSNSSHAFAITNHATGGAIDTFNPSSAETFGAAAYAHIHMSTPGESWQLASDGTNWEILNHYTHYAETITSPAITSTTATSPTVGTATINFAKVNRDEDVLVYTLDFKQTVAGTVGSGNYLWAIPHSWTADSSKVTIQTATTGGFVGTGWNHCAGINASKIWMNDSTHMAIFDTSATAVGAGQCPLSTAAIRYGFTARIPITNWEP